MFRLNVLNLTIMKKVIWALAILASFDGWAIHIFGGDFRMLSLPTQGSFTLTLTLYADANTLSSLGTQNSNNDESATVYIFRKKDHAFMQTIILHQQTQQKRPIIYQNEACAGNEGLRTTALFYSKAIYLNPSEFTDNEGYYIIWERCCRTAGVNNFKESGRNVGMVFTLEFPPLFKNGAYFPNSSPDFNFPNGEYICVHKPFSMNMSATDADGDELRYSLVTPLRGYTDLVNGFGSGQSRSFYPEITWATGYTLSNSIHGNPPLTIHPQTGEITLTANELGRYAFSILAEEYRNGVKIGAVRRDFQLNVIDCAGTPPPRPTIYNSSAPNQPATHIELCDSSHVQLQFSSSQGVSYQWQKDGNNLPNANGNTLTVTQSGEYRVVVSYSSKCALDTVSNAVKILKASSSITFDSLTSICYDPTLRIPLRAHPSNGTFEGNGVENTYFNVKKAGIGAHSITYRVTENKCTFEKTRLLVVKAIPQLSAPVSITQVRNVEKLLEAKSEATGTTIETYQWRPDEGIESPTSLQTNVIAPTSMLYTLTATSENGCSNQVSVQVVVTDLLYIPSAFSPNDDGINDTWEIENLAQFPEAEIFVYNRWGELIHYQSKEQSVPWNGMYDGKAAPAGEYTYLIKPNNHSEASLLSGKVVLLR